jgi:Family of unknown function (DUF6335)
MARKAARRRPGKAKTKKKTGAKARKPARRAPKKARARRAPAKKARARRTATRKKAARRRPARPAGPPPARASARQLPKRGRPERLDRERRRLEDAEDIVPGPPSSLNVDQSASAARSGREELREAIREHTETSPALTGGDVDADWEDAYAVGDEAPGGDNPTPDQDRVDDIGRALGVQYEDNEELKSADKIEKRDRNRWELDPASSEDYKDRD